MKKISLMTFVALAVLLIAAADPVSADDQIQIIIDDTNIISETYNHDDALNKAGKALNESYLFSCPPPSLKFMPEITDFKSLVIPTSEMQLYDYNIVNNNTPVVYKMASSPYTIIGEGDFYYRYDVDTGGGYIVLTADSWTRPSNVGPGSILYGITIEYQEPPNVKKIRAFSTNPVGTFDPTQFQPVIARSSSGNYDYVGETQIVNFERTFRQTVTGSAISADEYHISVARTDPSRIIVKSQKKINAYSDTSGSDNISLSIPYDERPFDISIYSTKNTYKWYNNTILAADIPIDPTDSSATVTVYVKNSQTGALIADANIVIDAFVNGEYYTVANRTEPSGIFSITLQPTGGGQPNPDGYRLIVTADGYNNPMPEINFTVDDYKNYIHCLLDPIAGGPVNENKTFIDFFVRDMASNPISGATVKFGKYTLITNSAGYTVFEVDKNNNYSWTVSKSGYGPLTGNAVIGDDPRHTINTVLAPIVTPTITTPIPTSPPIGPTPTMTAPTGEPVSNWLEWFAAHFGMILGGGAEIGKIFMWLCFAIPVGVYVGKEAKAGAAGFMAGAGIVTLFFVLIGWVPIWLMVLLALIIGLLYSKVLNTPDNGGGR